MKRITKFVSTTLVVAILFLFCGRVNAPLSEPVSPQKISLTKSEQELISADNRFGLKLFRKIVESEREQNIFISPLSISLALGMTLNGAVGQTRTDIEATLELQGLTPEQINRSYQRLIQALQNLDPRVILRIANSIWYRNNLSFKQEFIELNRSYFQAMVQALDFSDPQSVGKINDWVNQSTQGKIPMIIEKINPLDIMYIINAIYFKGTWQYEFNPNLTRADKFILVDGSKQDCQMMQIAGDFPYLQDGDLQAIDLPYGDGNFRMTIILPQAGTDPDSFIAQLDPERFNALVGSMKKQHGTLQMPKFKKRYGLSLNNLLKALGMGIAFDPGQADFRGMYEGTEKAYISEVIHKTFVEVNEEGTEAAAVTGVVIGITSVNERNFFMRVDRPFIYFIRENQTQAILFIGKLGNPAD
ncbi:MAG: serpin family protein [Calditrichia bacterium]